MQNRLKIRYDQGTCTLNRIVLHWLRLWTRPQKVQEISHNQSHPIDCMQSVSNFGFPVPRAASFSLVSTTLRTGSAKTEFRAITSQNMGRDNSHTWNDKERANQPLLWYKSTRLDHLCILYFLWLWSVLTTRKDKCQHSIEWPFHLQSFVPVVLSLAKLSIVFLCTLRNSTVHSVQNNPNNQDALVSAKTKKKNLHRFSLHGSHWIVEISLPESLYGEEWPSIDRLNNNEYP